MIVLYSLGFLFSCLMAYKSACTAIKSQELVKLIADSVILAYSVGTAVLYLSKIIEAVTK